MTQVLRESIRNTQDSKSGLTIGLRSTYENRWINCYCEPKGHK